MKIFKVLEYVNSSLGGGGTARGHIVLYTDGTVKCDTQYGFVSSNMSLLETINNCFSQGKQFLNEDLTRLFSGEELYSCDDNFSTSIRDVSATTLLEEWKR